MKLRIKIDQAEAFRRGINAPSDEVDVEVDPAELTHEQRELISEHLRGGEVCLLQLEPYGQGKMITRQRIVVPVPTLEAILHAIKDNRIRLEEELQKRGKRS